MLFDVPLSCPCHGEPFVGYSGALEHCPPQSSQKPGQLQRGAQPNDPAAPAGEGSIKRRDEGSPFLSRGLLKSQIFADLRISKFKKGRNWKKKSEGWREGCGCSKRKNRSKKRAPGLTGHLQTRRTRDQNQMLAERSPREGRAEQRGTKSCENITTPGSCVPPACHTSRKVLALATVYTGTISFSMRN